MTPELKYKHDLMEALQAYGYHVQAHEDSISNYIPDLSIAGNFVDAWVEVKYCRTPPKTLGTIKHYTKGQESWLIQRGRAGCSHCYLLVGTPKLHLLLPWFHLHKARDMPWVQLTQQAVCVIAAPDMQKLAQGFCGRVRLR